MKTNTIYKTCKISDKPSRVSNQLQSVKLRSRLPFSAVWSLLKSTVSVIVVRSSSQSTPARTFSGPVKAKSLPRKLSPTKSLRLKWYRSQSQHLSRHTQERVAWRRCASQIWPKRSIDSGIWRTPHFSPSQWKIIHQTKLVQRWSNLAWPTSQISGSPRTIYYIRVTQTIKV